jgi:hypothetical protein
MIILGRIIQRLQQVNMVAVGPQSVTACCQDMRSRCFAHDPFSERRHDLEN